MYLRFSSALAVVFIVGALASGLDRPKAKKDAGPLAGQRLQTGLAEFEAGKTMEAFQSLQPLLESVKPQQRAELDQALNEAGVHQSLSEFVAHLRLEILLRGKSTKMLPPGPVEAPSALLVIAKQFDDTQARIQNELDVGFGQSMPHKVMDEKSSTLQKLFREAKPMLAMLDVLDQIAKRIKPAELAKLSEVAQAIAARDFAGEKASIPHFEDQLLERLMELSVVRIADMIEVLGNDKAKYNDRLRAAGRINESLGVLHAHLDRYKRRKNRDPAAAKPAKLETQWKVHERKYREVSGRLAEKAYHLEQGKQWWLRGRFGAGPLYGGLAKATPLRTRNQELSLLAYPLRMPDPIRPPVDPLKDPRRVPPVRRLFQIANTAGQLSPFEQRLEGYYNAAPDDALAGLFGKETERAYRSLHQDARRSKLVGYLEYQLALYHFEALLNTTNAAEAQTIEEMIADDPRFAVHSYISRQFDSIDPNSTLKLPVARTEDPRVQGAYERRGLSWVMALARLEVGAMNALIEPDLANIQSINVDFGAIRDVAGNFRPRSSVDRSARKSIDRTILAQLPHAMEASAFMELLWDSGRTLYYQIRLETNAGPAFGQRVADLSQLAVHYAKICLAIDLIGAYRDAAGQSMTTAQKNEIQQWLTLLENLRGNIGAGMNGQVDGLGNWNSLEARSIMERGNSGTKSASQNGAGSNKGGMSRSPTIRPSLGGSPGIPPKKGGN